MEEARETRDSATEAALEGGAEASAEEQEARVEQDIGELIAGVERERDEYLELARRTKADLENYRKRVAGQANDAAMRARAELARELLPVLDNLERALENSAGAQDGLAEGLRLVLADLRAVLERAGVESYEPAGEQFDPHQHEAMLTRPTAKEDDGKVIEVLEKGYRLDGQVLRAARVVVGKQEQQQPDEAA